MRTGLLAAVVLAPLLAGNAGAQDESERPRLVIQLGHTMVVCSVAFSPDGQRVLTSGMDGTARLWDADSGREVQRFDGHTDQVGSAVFSHDGRRILTGSVDHTARLWDALSGREIQRFEGHSDGVLSVALSPDGRQILTASRDKTVRLWDVESGRETCRIRRESDACGSVAFSADGRRFLASVGRTARLFDSESHREISRFVGHTNTVLSVAFCRDDRVLTGSWDKTARLWDAESGKEVRRFEGHTGEIRSVAMSPDGRRVLTGSGDHTARLWNARSGQEILRFEGPGGEVMSAAFSPDGRYVLAGTATADFCESPIWLWDIESGKEVPRFQVRSSAVLSVALSADGRSIVTGSANGTVQLWNAESGIGIRRFEGHSKAVGSVAFSPDGEKILTWSEDHTARLWDTASGTEIRRFEAGVRAAFSPDGRRVLTGSKNNTALMWDAESGTEIRRFEGHADVVYSVAFSPDGRRVLTGSCDRTARLWDAESGREIRRLEGHSDAVFSVAFSPDGRRVLTGSWDKTARLWDAESGEEIRQFKGHSDPVLAAEFSPDGRCVLTGSQDHVAVLWDADSGRRIRRFEGHTGNISSVAFFPDGRRILTAGWDGTTRLWETGSGKEACALVAFLDGTCAVLDSEGRYDASNGGDVEGLHWVVGNEPIALDQLKERYYDPGLLAKHMGFSREPLRDVEAFTAPKLYPSATLEEKDGRLVVHLKNRGGGIGRVVLKVNGVERAADARDPAADPDARELTLSLDLAGDPRLKPGKPNRIEVFAFNAEGYLRSRGLEREWTPSGEASKHAPELWAIVAGISDYRGDTIDLRYAAKDAQDFATALSVAGERLFGKERLHLAHLEAATRESLVAALDAARKASPDDVLLVYLAGHGVNIGGPEGDYFFLCADAASADLKDPAVKASVALSSQQLAESLNAIPALKRVLVLDTCASGRLVEKLSEARDIPSSQVRAMERLKDRTGFYVIAGCASDRVSYEASRYGQGLLTYSLLLGMRGAALRDEEYVDVAKLFGFAADRVPELATGIGGIQRPVVAAPKGGASFDIGRLTSADKARVPIQAVRPMVLQSNFQDERRPRDTLGLAKLVNERLRDASSRGRDAPLVFIDASEFPDACEIGGRYRIEGGKVAVEVTVFRGEEEIGRFTVDGSADDLGTLATKIVDEAGQCLK